jgi:hypothetical protein
MTATPTTCQETAAAVYPTLFGSHNFPDFTMPNAGVVHLAWTGLNGFCDIWLVNAAGTQVAYQQGSDSAPNSSLTTAVLPAGSYFVAVDNLNFNEAGPTTIGVIVTGLGCPQPGSGSSGLLLALALGAAAVGGTIIAVRHHQHDQPHAPHPPSRPRPTGPPGGELRRRRRSR